MFKSVFEIPKMDCPSEENLIRMKLDGQDSIKSLIFNLESRELTIFHSDKVEVYEPSLISLNLGAKIKSSIEVQEVEHSDNPNDQRRLLWIVLLINFSFFILEILTGIISKSMGLVADSLDMLADSFVYGLSLMAVGSTLLRKKLVAKIAGYFQLVLAILGFVEVIRRFIGNEYLPNFSVMIIISIFSLIANAICLYLLQKSKSKEAHMQASMIFTSNDIIINVGVIIAGVLVYWLGSNIPDLVIGIIVFGIVVKGAFRILQLSK